MDIILVCIFCLAFFLLRLAFASPENTDEWVSFWLIERQKGHPWINYQVWDAVNSGIYAYPQFQHFLVSRFPRSWWGIVGRGLNAFYDIIVAVILFGLIRACPLPEGYHSREIAGLSPELAAVLLFLSMPVLMPTMSRMKTIKARSLGLLLCTAYFVCIGLVLLNGTWGWLLPAVIAAILIILSSMFALQVMCLFSAGLSLAFLSFIPLLPCVGSIVIALVFPRLGGRDALRFFWHHKLFYTKVKEKGTTAAGRNRLSDIFKLPGMLCKNPKQALNVLFNKNTFFIALYSAPGLVFALIAWLTLSSFRDALAGNFLLQFSGFTVLVSIGIFLLISLPPLSFLGQAERYLEYSSPFLAVLVVAGCLEMGEAYKAGVFWLIFGLQLSGIYVNQCLNEVKELSRSTAKAPESLRDIARWCVENLESANLLTVSVKLSYLCHSEVRRLSSEANINFYYRLMLRNHDNGFASHKELIGGFRETHSGFTKSVKVPQLPPERLYRDYNITHLLVDKSFLAGLEKTWGISKEIIEEKSVYQNSEYLLCAVQDLL